jgi:hypothetical protein
MYVPPLLLFHTLRYFTDPAPVPARVFLWRYVPRRPKDVGYASSTHRRVEGMARG